MKRLLLSIALLPFGILLQGQVLTPELLKEDFNIFRNSIQDIHPGLYWYADSTEIAKRFQQIENVLTQDMQLKEYYRLLQKFYVGIRCGHSWMSMPWAWRKPTDEGPYRIPLNFYLEKDRIVVFQDLSKDQNIGVGYEVISINDVSAKTLLDTLTQYTPTDGYAKTRQISILASNFSRYYQVHYGMDSIFTIQLKKDNQKTEYTLKGLTNEEANDRSDERYKLVKRSSKMLTYQVLENQVAYLKISSFDKEEIKNGKQNYKSFLKATFSEMREKNIDKLILDLRGNGGGEDNYGATLASYLLDKPFDYYLRMEAVTNKFRYNEYSYQRGFNTMGKLLKKDKQKPGTWTYNLSRQVKKQKPVKNPFKGELIMLINGGTFSASSEVAGILHSNKRAMFIGDETGGGYYGNNSAMMYGIQLPNSKINYYLPVIRYYVAVDHPPFKGRGLIPDIYIPETYEYYLTEQDEILEYAVNKLK